MNDLRGKTIKGYTLIEKLGEGGMGLVYRAFQKAVQREVAIKVILPEYASEPEFIRRFEAEAQLVARLEHPFIVPLFDYWRDPDGAYLVTRYYTGGSLRHALETRGKFDLLRAMRAVDQLTGALAVAHRNGIIHRDMKPENILLDDQDNFYLSDFGIARRLSDPYDAEEEDEFTGSPAYVPPEQIQGSAVQPQTDLYSLGYIIYEILTGRHAFQENTLTQLSPTQFIIRHLNDDLPESPELPQEINQVLRRATSKDPAQRYQTALALGAAFEAAIHLERIHPVESGGATGRTTVLVNPYKGLRPFEEADAGDFYGREDLISRLVARMELPHDWQRFLAVIGPSGSGKSSVVKAGLLPALRASREWFFTEMVPGIDPFSQLESALLMVAVAQVPNLPAWLRADSTGILDTVNAILPNDGTTELLLVIDQFEELFTQVESEAVRRKFLDSLYTAVTDPNSRLRVVITLRADFYDRPLVYEGFGALLRERSEVVLPLATTELERAIAAPAERSGMTVDAALIAALVADVNAQPGALPLMQYVMTEVFERREGAVLNLAAYTGSGGMVGALARRAEDLYLDLDTTDRTQPRRAVIPLAAREPAPLQALARQVFLRLVTPGEGADYIRADDTRRRVTLTELLALADRDPGDREEVQSVLDAFARYRLLTFDHDPVTREPTVEVAHEALIRSWSRLRGWLDDNRAALQLQRALMNAASDWRKSRRDAAFLLRGSRLAQFEEWQSTTDLQSTPEEQEFLQASLELREVERAEEAARIARERALQAQSRQRLRLLVAVMTIAALVGLGLAALAFNQSLIAHQEATSRATQQAVAETNAQLAERRAQESQSLLWANSAQSALQAGQTDFALALALQAVAMHDPPAQSEQVLYDAAFTPGIVRRFTGHETGVLSVTLTPDGQTAISGDLNGTILVWNVASGAEVRRLTEHTKGVNGLAVSPDGTRLLSASEDGQVILWNLADGKVLRRLEGHTGAVNAVVFTPDGYGALTGGADAQAILWNLDTGEIKTRFAAHSASVNAVAINAAGTQALTASDDNQVMLWNLPTGERAAVFSGHTEWVFAVAFSPDGTQALSGAFDDTLILWDIDTGKLIRKYEGHENSVQALVFSADGSEILSASSDHTLILWDTASGAVLHRFGTADSVAQSSTLQSSGHTDAVLDVALDRNGNRAVSASNDGSLIVWALQDGGIVQRLPVLQTSVITSLALNQDNSRLISTSFDKSVALWDVSDTAAQPLWHQTYSTWLSSAAFAPDGQTALVGADDGAVMMWDTSSGSSGEILKTLGGDFAHSDGVTSLAYASDGRTAASGSGDHSIILWDPESGQSVAQLLDGGHTKGVTTLAFNPGGTLLASGGVDQQVILWDLASRAVAQTLNGHDQSVTGVAFSPDGTMLLTADAGGTILLWNLSNGTVIRRLEGRTETVWSVRFVPGSKYTTQYALSASADGTVILWDVIRGEILHRYSGHGAGVSSLVAAGDGLSAISGSDNGDLIQWRVLLPDGVITWAKDNRAIPEFSCAQRTRYRIVPLCEMAAGEAAP